MCSFGCVHRSEVRVAQHAHQADPLRSRLMLVPQAACAQTVRRGRCGLEGREVQRRMLEEDIVSS